LTGGDGFCNLKAGLSTEKQGEETMKIGMIVYSQTGNTLGVAEKVRDELVKKGHEVVIERVLTEGGDPKDSAPIRLTAAPDPNGYDAVVFASPVQAFSLAQGMKLYFQQRSKIDASRVCCFVTQHFPKPWMGGNHAIRQMREYCRAAGATVTGTGVVNWTNKSRDAQMETVVRTLTSALCGDTER